MSIDEDEVGVTLSPATAASLDAIGERETATAEPPADALPFWFAIVLVASLTWVTVAGALGVVLLYFGWYQPALLIALATIAAVGAACSPVVPRPQRGARQVHWAAAAALIIAAGFSIIAGAYHSEHLLVERDPAVYINVGRTIADTHQLDPKTNGGPFDNHDLFLQDSPSVTVVNGRVVAGFFHMLPVLLAVGFSIGGDTGMLLVPAILGGLGLVALYALASRVVGPRWALLAPSLLVIGPLQLWFARDAYSELVVQPLLLGGIWLFLSARRGPVPRAALGGAFIAATFFARVDALAFVACAFPMAAFEWIRAPRRDVPAARRRAVLGLVGGVGVTGLVAFLITRSLSAPYLAVLHTEYHQLLAGCAAALVVSIGMVVIAQIAPTGLGGKIARNHVLFGGIVVVAALLFVYFSTLRIKPISEIPKLLPRHKMTAELRTAINEWHWRYALRWFFEYFGVVAIIVAVVGLLLMLWRALRGSGVATTVLCMLLPVTVLYIWRPNISPDQPWAMRRYLPATFPAIAIAITVVLTGCWLVGSAKRAIVFRVFTLLLAFAIVVPMAIAARPFAKMSMQDGALDAVHELCRAAGPDAAILILGFNYIDVEMPATFRAFCNQPSAKPRDQHLDIAGLAREFEADGRRLVVATSSPSTIEQAGVGARRIAHVRIPDAHEPDRTTDRRPRTVAPRPADVYLYEVPTSPSAVSAG